MGNETSREQAIGLVHRWAHSVIKAIEIDGSESKERALKEASAFPFFEEQCKKYKPETADVPAQFVDLTVPSQDLVVVDDACS